MVRPILFGLAAALAAAPALAQSDGAQHYTRCAACHLPTGAGVPGAFPPLNGDVRALAGTAAGRRYLALAVIHGLSGPITAEGKPYAGVMPAQATGLSDADIAALLTHVTGTIAKAGPAPRPFTAAEIQAAREAGKDQDAAAIARSQPKLAAK